MQEIIDSIIALTFEYGWRIFAAIAILVIGKIVASRLADLSHKALDKTGMDAMLTKFIKNLVYTLLLICVVLAALKALTIDITSLLVIVSAAGLAVGLALKDSLSNFASGVMILIFRPFKIGDFINAGGSSGVVDEIGMFCTLMHTPDNQRIIVPNSAVINGTITNVSALPTRRIDLVIGISYDDNIGQAKDIITRVVKADERVLAEPEFSIGVAELADSSVNLFVRPWVNSAEYWPTRSALIEGIKNALDEAGITIPYPQQDVHMHQANQP